MQSISINDLQLSFYKLLDCHQRVHDEEQARALPSGTSCPHCDCVTTIILFVYCCRPTIPTWEISGSTRYNGRWVVCVSCCFATTDFLMCSLCLMHSWWTPVFSSDGTWKLWCQCRHHELSQVLCQCVGMIVTSQSLIPFMISVSPCSVILPVAGILVTSTKSHTPSEHYN